MSEDTEKLEQASLGAFARLEPSTSFDLSMFLYVDYRRYGTHRVSSVCIDPET